MGQTRRESSIRPTWTPQQGPNIWIIWRGMDWSRPFLTAPGSYTRQHPRGLSWKRGSDNIEAWWRSSTRVCDLQQFQQRLKDYTSNSWIYSSQLLIHSQWEIVHFPIRLSIEIINVFCTRLKSMTVFKMKEVFADRKSLLSLYTQLLLGGFIIWRLLSLQLFFWQHSF